VAGPPGVRGEEQHPSGERRPSGPGEAARRDASGPEQQPGHAGGQQDQAGEVEPGIRPTAGGEAGRDPAHRGGGEYAERHVDEEDAAPAAHADERTANRRAYRRAGEQQDAGQR